MSGTFTLLWLYLLAPIVGGIAAALPYSNVVPKPPSPPWIDNGEPADRRIGRELGPGHGHHGVLRGHIDIFAHLIWIFENLGWASKSDGPARSSWPEFKPPPTKWNTDTTAGTSTTVSLDRRRSLGRRNPTG